MPLLKLKNLGFAQQHFLNMIDKFVIKKRWAKFTAEVSQIDVKRQFCGNDS